MNEATAHYFLFIGLLISPFILIVLFMLTNLPYWYLAYEFFPKFHAEYVKNETIITSIIRTLIIWFIIAFYLWKRKKKK